MDKMSDLTGLTHPTFGRNNMIQDASGRKPPWLATKAPKKKAPAKGIGAALFGKKKKPTSKEEMGEKE